MKQLPLAVRLHDGAQFASFLPGPNGEALAAARALAAGSGATRLYLHGAPATGRSHLLQAICANVPGAGYFPLGELRALGAGVLEGAEQLPLVALDDLDAVAGEAEWERRLFGLYNACLAGAGRVAAAARAPAADLAIVLPDLRSRLGAMPHYALRPLDDMQQRAALATRAAARGIELPEEILLYLQNHFARDMARLTGLLDQLDRESLQAQRRVTLPFIREVLEKPA